MGSHHFAYASIKSLPFFPYTPCLDRPHVFDTENQIQIAQFFSGISDFFFVNPMDKIIGDVNGENYILTNTYRVFFRFVQTKRFYHQCFVLEINMNSNSQFGYYHSSTWFCKVLNMEAPQIRSRIETHIFSVAPTIF